MSTASRPIERRADPASPPEPAPAPDRPRSAPGLEVYGLLIAAFAVLLLLALVSFDPRDVAFEHKLRVGGVRNLIGPVGAHVANLLFRLIGLGAFLACSTFFYFGGLLLAGRRTTFTGGGVLAYGLTVVFACVICHLFLAGFLPFAHAPGGLVGEWVGEILRSLFATTGTIIIAAAAMSASLLTLSGMKIADAAQLPYRGVRWAADKLERRRRGQADDAASPLDGDDVADEDASAVPAGRDTPTERPCRIVEQAPAGEPVVEEEPESQKARVRNRTRTAAPTSGKPPSKGPEAADDAGVEPSAAQGDSGADPAIGKKEDRESPPARAKTPAAAGPEITELAAPADPVISELPPSGPLPLVGEEGQLPFGGKRPFEFPSLSLLHYEPPARHSVDRSALSEAARTLEAKLADFGVTGKVVKIQPGPVVTMFEFLPAAGVKISKIANLADDLTMALHAQRVRIVAPIPGKGVVGIEVPSAVRETVFLKEILASKEFQESRGKLPVCLGKDIGGRPVATDLARMPHVLVAGSTGSGKSVAINTFIVSLVYRQKPSDLRLILVDPKMLELSVYDDIPHLLLPVVTEPKKASLALKWAVAEMERRYRLLAACSVRNIAGFNQKVEKYRSGAKEPPEGVAADELEHLPYIVIVLDELADLMMVSGKDVEQSIARLAQMARAAGLHLVVATQRPSVDVITGLIKANFPTRISFMVSQKVDSRTILDRMGAENLLGMGDMLFLPPGTSKLERVQGAFVSDEEVERITDHLRKFGPPDYDMDILIDEDEQAKDLSSEDYDSLFDEAVAIVTETRNPSISYLQRRLKIGYNRSARIIERMQFDGVISAADHRGARKVLAPESPPLD